MKRLFAIAARFFGLRVSDDAKRPPKAFAIDQMIQLDAEQLAEGGISSAYDRLLPALKRHLGNPANVKEIIDEDAQVYAMESNGIRYDICGPDIPDADGRSWGNAAFAIFDIVNRQLINTQYRFYAINGGNDLCGIFLSESDVQAAVATLNRKDDWPYLPTRDHPWYGQHH